MSSRREAVGVAGALLALTAISVAAWTTLRGAAPVTVPLLGHHGLPWWMLAPLALGVEHASIVIHGRRQSRTFTVSEIVLVLGLVFWAPGQLILGRLVGTAASELSRSRRAPVKVAVNVAMVVTETTMALALYGVVARRLEFPHPLTGLALVASAAAANICSALVLSALIGWLERANPLPMLASSIKGDLLPSVTAGAFGLAAAYALYGEPASVVVLIGCAIAAGAFYRTYVRLQNEHNKLSCLYRFNRQLAACENSRELTEQTLELSRVLLHAEHAEMVLRGHDEASPLTRVVSPLDGELSRLVAPAEDLDPVLVAAADSSSAHTLVVHGRGSTRLLRRALVAALPERPGLRQVLALVRGRRPPDAERGEAYLQSLGFADGVSVPLGVEDRHLGCLVVAGRMGRELGFTADEVDLLATMASQAAIALHRSELIDRVQWEATHDSLTGLPNRLMFNRCTQEALLSSALARAARGAGTARAAGPDRGPERPPVPAPRRPVDARGDRVSGVAMLDLDRFHDVNDTFGHDVADTLLREVALRLSGAAGDGVLVARLGSDEFGVLVHDCPTREHLLDVVAALVGSLAEPIAVGDTSMSFTACTGVALVEAADADVTSLVVQADVALQAAKTRGTPIVVYSPEIDNRAPHRMAIAADLRAALRDGDLAVHVQPQADLATGCLVGVEALVRWQHPTRGLVFPDEFIPVAETSGLVGELTHVVLDQALAAVARWRDVGLVVPIAVNLSARSLADPDLVSSVQRALRRHRLPAQLLTLEITESSVMSDPQRAIRTLTQLRGLGITLAVDDFGTGYSSLSYLKRLPVQEVKIDKSFVMTLCEDAENASIVRSIVDLGKNLGLKVIAEGVEGSDAWDLLAMLGCDVAQGYHLARPMPGDDLPGWLAASTVVRRPAASVV